VRAAVTAKGFEELYESPELKLSYNAIKSVHFRSWNIVVALQVEAIYKKVLGSRL
jgi:hypothetical protein